MSEKKTIAQLIAQASEAQSALAQQLDNGEIIEVPVGGGDTSPPEFIDDDLVPEVIEVDKSLWCKIWRYIEAPELDFEQVPVGHDFVHGLTIKPYRRRTINGKGKLENTRYYADPEYQDMLVRVDYTYELDALAWPISHTAVYTWFLENGDPAETTKTEITVYGDNLKKIAALEMWRNNQIRLLKMRAIQLLVLTTPVEEGDTQEVTTYKAMVVGQDFMAAHKAAFTNYVEDAHLEIFQILQTAPDPWLNNLIPGYGVPIRAYLLSGLADG